MWCGECASLVEEAACCKVYASGYESVVCGYGRAYE